MSKHDFGYFFHEGLSNMFSHGFMSFAAIGVTVACLVIMGTFTLVAVNADAQLKDLESENEFLAFVDESLTRSEAEGLKARIEAVPNVRSVRFITREEATEAFAAQYPDEQMFQDLDPERSLELMDLLVRINALGTTVVVVTHEKELVNRFGKRVVTLEKGRVIRDRVGGYVGGRIHE